MDLDEIERLLRETVAVAELELAADGNRLMVKLVSDDFDGLNRVKRQQLLYGALNELIASGEVHAVTMQTQTPAEAAGE